MWRKLTEKEIIEEIEAEERAGVCNLIQELVSEEWKGKDVEVWTFNEGSDFEVREVEK